MWIVLIAALLAALMLIQSVGVEAAVFLAAATIVGMVVWRAYRKRHPAAPPKPPETYCLRCGAVLAATARNCNQCGSAAWSVRD